MFTEGAQTVESIKMLLELRSIVQAVPIDVRFAPSVPPALPRRSAFEENTLVCDIFDYKLDLRNRQLLPQASASRK